MVGTTLKTRLKRTRGAGMTEYVITVGLLAVLLIGAVGRFKAQVDATIEGTGNDVDGVASQIKSSGSPASSSGDSSGVQEDSPGSSEGHDAAGHRFVKDADSKWHPAN